MILKKIISTELKTSPPNSGMISRALMNLVCALLSIRSLNIFILTNLLVATFTSAAQSHCNVLDERNFCSIYGGSIGGGNADQIIARIQDYTPKNTDRETCCVSGPGKVIIRKGYAYLLTAENKFSKLYPDDKFEMDGSMVSVTQGKVTVVRSKLIGVTDTFAIDPKFLPEEAQNRIENGNNGELIKGNNVNDVRSRCRPRAVNDNGWSGTSVISGWRAETNGQNGRIVHSETNQICELNQGDIFGLGGYLVTVEAGFMDFAGMKIFFSQR